MSVRMICSGIHVEDIVVPPFQVDAAEYVALMIPFPYGDSWARLLDLLTGSEESSSLQLNAVTIKGQFATPPFYNTALLALPLLHYLHGLNITEKQSHELLGSLRLSAELAVEDLQLTSRLELDISIMLLRGAELIAFTTSGLDPTGKRRVGHLVTSAFPRCSAIGLECSGSEALCKEIGLHTRYVHCISE